MDAFTRWFKSIGYVPKRTGRGGAMEHAASIAELIEKRRHDRVGDPRVKVFVPYIANEIRAFSPSHPSPTDKK